MWRNIVWYKHSRVQAKFKDKFTQLILLWCLCILGLQIAEQASGKRLVFWRNNNIRKNGVDVCCLVYKIIKGIKIKKKKCKGESFENKF